jgi:hypothetical protein
MFVPHSRPSTHVKTEMTCPQVAEVIPSTRVEYDHSVCAPHCTVSTQIYRGPRRKPQLTSTHQALQTIRTHTLRPTHMPFRSQVHAAQLPLPKTHRHASPENFFIYLRSCHHNFTQPGGEYIGVEPSTAEADEGPPRPCGPCDLGGGRAQAGSLKRRGGRKGREKKKGWGGDGTVLREDLVWLELGLPACEVNVKALYGDASHGMWNEGRE